MKTREKNIEKRNLEAKATKNEKVNFRELWKNKFTQNLEIN